jgi:hypothetical protein
MPPLRISRQRSPTSLRRQRRALFLFTRIDRNRVDLSGDQDSSSVAAFGVVSRTGGPWRSLRGGEIDAGIELDLRL